MRKRKTPCSVEMSDRAFRFGVAPGKIDACTACGNSPTLTGHPGFPQLWLFKSSAAALHFRATGECHNCQDQAHGQR
jgi:hypothetical protein